MSARLAELLNVWDNPVFQRFRRSRLRARKAVFWYLLTLIVTTFVVMLGYILRTNAGIPERDAARALWLPVLIIQGLILMLRGTGTVSATLIQDRLEQTLDYQRLTPVTPLRNLIGYVFGLPVLEYTMFALTLPHLAFVVIVGEVPLVTLGAVYLSFLTCVVLYHVTAISVGMVMQRWILGYLVGVLTVAFVNVVLPLIVSQFGLKFLQYLSVWPVISQKLLPLLLTTAQLSAVSNPFLSMADTVPFYAWTLSPFVFTLLLQGALILTFAVIALRRWKVSGRHALGKPFALAFLVGFIVLLLGNVWPALTRQYMPFALFGVTDLDQLGPVIAIGLPLVYCLIIWLLAFVLLAAVTPTHHACLRGLRRAVKLGRSGTRPWEDDAANPPFAAALTLLALTGFAVLMQVATASGFIDFLHAAGFSTWRLPVVFTLVLVYTAMLLQGIELRPTVMAILLVWLLPILVAILTGAAVQDTGTLQAVIASLSPLALLVMAGLLPLQYVAGPEITIDGSDALLTGVTTGLAFLTLQIGWLAWRWHRLATELRGVATRGSRESPVGAAVSPA
jgi:hypothetical protein